MTDLETGIQKAKTLYEGFNTNNGEKIMSVLHPKVHWLSFGPDGIPPTGEFHGHDGAQDFFKKLHGHMDIRRFTPNEYYVSHDGKLVQVFGVELGYIRSSGEPFVNNFSHTFWFDDEWLAHKFRVHWVLHVKEWENKDQ